jgi:subtilisin family serine protease/subtilisin-like proprotein convertase family protein
MTHRLRFRAARRLRVDQLEDRCTPSAAFEAGRVLVAFAEPAGNAALASVAGSPLADGASPLGSGTYLVDLAGGVSVGTAVSAFAAVPGVRFAEPDYTIGVSVIPNDPSFGSLWGLHNTGQSGGLADADIDAPAGWDTARGTGQTVVGIIDTGVDYTHPDLYRNIWINQDEIPSAVRSALADLDADGRITFRDLNDPANQGAGKITDLNANGRIDAGDLLNNASGWENAADNDSNGRVDDLVGWDFVNGDNDPIDDNNHGTHVAGTIGATGDNGVGVAGVAWTTQIMALKFLGASGSGATSGAVSAVNYATGEGARLTNNSWGGGGFSSSLFTAIDTARAAGSLFVAAAGNANANNDATTSYPSGYNLDNIVAVASTDRLDRRSGFSSYGATTVDLGAPGSSILSTVRNGGYSTFSGTSMATPHVSGAFVVLLDANPGLTYRQAIDRILQTVRPVAALNGVTVTGGVLNLQAALSGLSPPPPPPGDTAGPRVTSAAFSGDGGTFTRVRFTFSEAINPTSFTVADVVSLSGPGGAIMPAVAPVAGTSNQFDVTFATQTAAGTYTVVIGPDITDAAGNTMNQNGVAPNGEVPGDRYTATGSLSGRLTFTNANSYAIRDRQTTVVPIGVGIGLAVADIDVRLNISHTWDSDLRLYLRAPNGRQITLANRVGGSGNNFTNTTFDDEAAVSIRSGSAPFAGTFRPEQLLSTFDGLAASGTWQLRVYDAAGGDIGTVNSVTLSILFADGGSWVHTLGFGDEPAPAVTRLATDFAPARDAGASAPSGVVVLRRAVRRGPSVESAAVAGPAIGPIPVRGIARPSVPTADRFAEFASDFAPVEV